YTDNGQLTTDNCLMTLAFTPLPCPDSPLRRIDPRWKLAGLSIVIVGVALLRMLPAALTALAFSLILALLGRLPGRWYVTRLVLLFLSPFVLARPFLLPGGPSWPGIILALVITAKALALVTLALVLFTSAPLNDTLKAAHALRVPGLLVQLFALTYRYLFLVA